MSRLLKAATAALLLAVPARAARAPARARAASARSWAVFYGAQLSSASLRSLDVLMADPDTLSAPRLEGGPVRLAYVSAGEADERRWFWPKVSGRPFVIEPDPDWPGAQRVDVRSPEWRRLFALAASSALAKGYDGFFVDTLDVADYYESSAPVRFAESRAAAVSLVHDLRRDHPDAPIVVNNALPLLGALAQDIDGVAVEDLYTRCRPDGKPCAATPEDEARAKERVLRAFKLRTGKPVFAILYARLDQRRERWLRKAQARARKNGFLVYVADPSLERLGDVAPR